MPLLWLLNQYSVDLHKERIVTNHDLRSCSSLDLTAGMHMTPTILERELSFGNRTWKWPSLSELLQTRIWLKSETMPKCCNRLAIRTSAQRFVCARRTSIHGEQ